LRRASETPPALAGAAGSPVLPARPELSVTASAPARNLTFRWRNSDDDSCDAERAEAERLRDEGKLIEPEAGLESSNTD
jgi:hypothetical protein